MKEWPDDLLYILADPMFDDVKVPVKRVTPDDRIKTSFSQINEWVATHGQKPTKTSERTERSLAIQLAGIRANEAIRQYLLPMDKYNLLKIIDDE